MLLKGSEEMADMPVADCILDRNGLTDAVRNLLDESRAHALCREHDAFDSAAAGQNESLVLFGAGNLGRKTLAGLRKAGIEPVSFTDSNSALWNQRVDGLNVIAPEEAARLYGTTSTFVITIWTGEGYDRMGERRQKLNSIGCRRVVPFTLLFWKYADLFLPHYAVDLPHGVLDQAEEVVRGCDLWSDDASRFEYLAQLRWRLLSDFDVMPNPVAPPTYFPRDLFQLKEREIFVDCGAFDGDTIRSLLEQPNGSSASVYAFEADPGNFANLQKTVSQVPHSGLFTIYNLAVGASSGPVRFRAFSNEASYVSALGGDISVDSVTLDQMLGGVEPTFIKMDIEGAELDSLRGASEIIGRCAPRLAICSYHRQDHLWRIPLLIQSLNRNYQFYLRPHLLEGWDLVCYAIPSQRARIQPGAGTHR
jgi:FkbM family methyltransferase